VRRAKIGLLMGGAVAILYIGTWAQEASNADPLKAQIDALKAPKVAWRGIPWRTCLADGLRESAEKKKPVLLWVFIDRPVDDKRC
jgi:hypothetical protein